MKALFCNERYKILGRAQRNASSLAGFVDGHACQRVDGALPWLFGQDLPRMIVAGFPSEEKRGMIKRIGVVGGFVLMLVAALQFGWAILSPSARALRLNLK